MFPALAVARELRARGHRLLFLGTREKMEARLVPEAGFEIQFIRTGALNRVSLGNRFGVLFKFRLGIRCLASLAAVPAGCGFQYRRLRRGSGDDGGRSA